MSVCVAIDLTCGEDPIFIYKEEGSTRKRARPSATKIRPQGPTVHIDLVDEDVLLCVPLSKKLLPVPYEGVKRNGIYMKRADEEMAVCAQFFL